MKSGKVIKSPLFNLIEGTRAVEVKNPSLDTTMIKLSKADIQFDTLKPCRSDQIIGIMTGVLRLYMSWLDSSTLSATVLSCRYMYILLANYLNHDKDISFKDQRLKNPPLYDEESIEYLLVHKVLKAFIVGVSKLIDISISISIKSLNEEEDISTRNYGFNFLSDVLLSDVIDSIESSVSWTEKQEQIPGGHRQIIINLLYLVRSLASIESIFSIKVRTLDNLPNYPTSECPGILSIDDAILRMKALMEVNLGSFDPPEASFSQFVQVDYSTESIPEQIYMLPVTECCESMLQMLVQIRKFINETKEIANVYQLERYLIYNISKQLSTRFTSICRGIFQLFLIRDDKSILGSNQDLTSISMEYMKAFTCLQSAILQPDSWNSIQGKESQISEIKTETLNRLGQILQEIESGIYHNMIALTSNRCKRRQLFNRGIVIWDTLQANAEVLEMDLWANYRIGDSFEGTDIPERLVDQPCLALSSFIYATKLRVMIDVALSGIELEIYRPFEMSFIFWYASYLCKSFLDIFNSRIMLIIALRKNHILHTLPKRIKKLKAGVKKQALKERYEYESKYTIPQLDYNARVLQSYYMESYDALYKLTDAMRLIFLVFYSLGLIELFPSFSMATFEKIFSLRMKPWSSIGVPETPTFTHYKSTFDSVNLKDVSKSVRNTRTKGIVVVILEKLASTKQIYHNLIQWLKSEETGAINEGAIEWYESLMKTSVQYSLLMNNLLKQLDENFDEKALKLLFEQGYNPYFPKPVFTPSD